MKKKKAGSVRMEEDRPPTISPAEREELERLERLRQELSVARGREATTDDAREQHRLALIDEWAG